jgi:hypothetical protein
MPTGTAAQIGYAVESTAGTFVTPTDFFEFVPPLGLVKRQEYVKSRGIRANRVMPHAVTLGKSNIEGPVTHELVAEGIGILLRAMIEGTPTTTGSGPYTHVFDHSTDLASISAQTALPSTSAVHPMSYAGLRVRQWTINVNPGDVYPTLTIEWIGKSLDADGTPSLTSASYASFTRFTFLNATFSIAGSEVCVDNITITGQTGFDMEHKICSTDAGTPNLFRGARAMVTGSAQMDLADLTQFNRYLNGTQAALSLALNAGASAQLTLAGNVFFPEGQAVVSDEGKTKQPIGFEFLSGTNDASALTVTLINGDSSA